MHASNISSQHFSQTPANTPVNTPIYIPANNLVNTKVHPFQSAVEWNINFDIAGVLTMECCLDCWLIALTVVLAGV